MEQNVKLNDLMFKALDHGVDSVSGGGDLVPFVMTENNLQRFVASTLEESKEQAEKFLISLRDEPVAALAYGGYLTTEGKKFSTVFVKVFDLNEDKGILLVQRYEPKAFLRKLQLVGNPGVVERPLNPWK